jgi:hypothetical protein
MGSGEALRHDLEAAAKMAEANARECIRREQAPDVVVMCTELAARLRGYASAGSGEAERLRALRESNAANTQMRVDALARLRDAEALLRDKAEGERCVFWKPKRDIAGAFCVSALCWFCRYRAFLAATPPRLYVDGVQVETFEAAAPPQPCAAWWECSNDMVNWTPCAVDGCGHRYARKIEPCDPNCGNRDVGGGGAGWLRNGIGYCTPACRDAGRPLHPQAPK